jgi:hypothetical protein
MKTVELENDTLEFHYGRNVDKMSALLGRCQKGEGYIPSEADIRLLGVRNFGTAPQIANNYFDSSTLSATKGDALKVILPHETGSRELTEAARFGLELINQNERLVNYGINLDKDSRWEKLDGNGVYTLKRKGLILNQDLTEDQAMNHDLLLTKLGHPDHVDGKFARSKDEVAEIIGKTFKLGKSEHGYDAMMGQYLPDVSKKGILKAWYSSRLGDRSGSGAWPYLGSGSGQFAFYSVGDAETDAEGVDTDKARVQLAGLEGVVNPDKLPTFALREALDERDVLKERLLTTDQIYSAIESHIASANEPEVRKIIDGLTHQ